MTKTIEIDVAQATLSEIVADLGPGEEVLLVRNSQPVARLIPANGEKPKPQFGGCADLVTIVEDDDEHLEQFADYMP